MPRYAMVIDAISNIYKIAIRLKYLSFSEYTDHVVNTESAGKYGKKYLGLSEGSKGAIRKILAIKYMKSSFVSNLPFFTKSKVSGRKAT